MSTPIEFGDFFKTLALDEIYAMSQPKGRSIIVESFDPTASGVKVTRQVLKQEAEEDKKYAFTHWFPHYAERQLLLQLARAVSKTDKPTILEAGCGSGFVSRLLAADGQAKVIGVDSALEEMGYQQLADLPHNLQFIKGDLWDVLDRTSPRFDPKQDDGGLKARERRELLLKIRRDYEDQGPVFENIWHNVQAGDYQRLNSEVARLQELTRLCTRPSSVDLVFCSFMPTKVDLTVPIRDGIYPKIIVYVRTIEGYVGAGDFYLGGENTIDNETGAKDVITPNTVISLNPGANYHTAVRWRTHEENDWYSSDQRFEHLLGGEVIVQLRNDVALRSVQVPSLERYVFDDQVEEELEKYRLRAKRLKFWGFKDVDFLAGISASANTLFSV